MEKPDYIKKLEEDLEKYYLEHPEQRPKIEEKQKIIEKPKIIKSLRGDVSVDKIKKFKTIDELNEEFEKDFKKMDDVENQIKQTIKKNGYKNKLQNKMIKKLTKLADQEPFIIYYPYVKYRGSEVIQYVFKNKKYTKDEIRKITNEFSKYLHNKNIRGNIQNNVYYDALGDRSSQFTPIGEDVEMFDPGYNERFVVQEQKKFKKFSIFLILKNNENKNNEKINNNINDDPLMGTDNNNDCLYYCLKYILLEKIPWKHPIDLKSFCNVKYNEKIPFNKISIIEKELKGYSINITGDEIYTSPIQSLKQIHLLLIDNHITINYNINNKKTNCRKDEKTILLYDKVSKIGYDGINERVLSNQEKYEILNNYKSPYILVNRCFFSNKKRLLGLMPSLSEEYNEMINEFDKIKKATDGVINFYKTGTIIDTAKTLFNKFSLSIYEGEELTLLEHQWINNSSIGALTNIEKDYKCEKLYKYDINSMYPSIMTSTNKLPLKQGEFKIMDKNDFEELKFFTFGIYRCIINKSDDENINRLFRFNKLNYYTHITLEAARKLNLKIELIEDGEYNFLHYSRDKLIEFRAVFKSYVDYLYNFKQQKISPYFKDVLNILWGSLCEKNTKKLYVNGSNDKLNIKDDLEIISISPCASNENLIKFKVIQTKNIYKHKYARISPFILSIGRKTMSDMFLHYKDNLKYIRTDGVLLNKEIDINSKIKLGLGIGDLRYEGYYNNPILHNLNNIEGEFIKYEY